MDMIYENNYIKLCGTPAAAPSYSHSSRGRQFYTFPLEVRRLSGTADRLNIVLDREQLSCLEIQEQDYLCVIGQLRTWNNRRGEGAKLVITVLAKELFFCDGPEENIVRLRGSLCKAPNPRVTPMGRDICDLMLAINRPYGRSDYLPCICWGIKAREAANWSVGSALQLEGRLQSRSYIKLTEEGCSQRTAFEVSVCEISELVNA